MNRLSRRSFLQTTAAGLAAAGLGISAARGQRLPAPPGERAQQDEAARVLLPRGRVPLSFIIDDSTCLVNMGHFCMPQFAEAWPDREIYKRPWKTWPREIPDAFVREFGEWCNDHGVKGKYSVVPYPACVGWLDRELPGWSRRELLESLRLVRELLAPNWDIHPEMITHTRVIDLATGRPLPEISSATMENSYPQVKKSVDELAAYLAYALRILKNCDLPCEGITTPGGFGNLVKEELSLAVWDAVRDVYAAPLPHYFKYVSGGDESTEPKLEHVAGLDTDDPRAVVNIPAGTGDWFGGWEGDQPVRGDLYANHDATSGRMVELIEQGRPAVMLCHWPGIYCNGTKEGLKAFQQIVLALADRFGDQTQWMKLAEMARYWAAKELTEIRRLPAAAGNGRAPGGNGAAPAGNGRAPGGEGFVLRAPFAAEQFTLALRTAAAGPPKLVAAGQAVELQPAARAADLCPGTWRRVGEETIVCFDLPRGRTTLAW